MQLENNTNTEEKEVESRTSRSVKLSPVGYKFLISLTEMVYDTMHLHVSSVVSSVLAYELSDRKTRGVPEIRIFADVCSFWKAMTSCTATKYNRIINDNSLVPDDVKDVDRIVMTSSFPFFKDYLKEVYYLLLLLEIFLLDDMKVLDNVSAEVFHRTSE